MGTVYLAEGEDGGRVAIKVINRQFAGEAAFRERFRREVTAARRVRPFCTAPVLDADLEGDPVFVVTEYIQGPTLQQVVSSHGPLRGSNLEGLAVGVASALSAIHGAGIAHRDLKPSNILLSSYGPRVIDFGIARALDVDGVMTKTGETMGTPAYMAPEGLRGEPVTQAADVFAWGCVVAFAGTGRPPFSGANVSEILYRTAHAEPRLDGLEPRLRDLVVRATAKNPADRPAVNELLGDLTGQTDAGRIARSSLVTATAPDHGPPAARTALDISPATPTALMGDTAAPAEDDGPGGRARGEDGRARVPRTRVAGLPRGGWLLLFALVLSLVATVVVINLDLNDPGHGQGAPPRAAENLMNDDFSVKGRWSEGQFEQNYHLYSNGGYEISAFSVDPYQTQAAPLDMVLSKVMMTVTVSVRSNDPLDAAGVYCHGGSRGRYEVVILRNRHARVRRVLNDQVMELARSRGEVSRPEGGRLQVTCQDDGPRTRIRAWVDGALALEAVDAKDPLTDGKIGFVVGRDGRGWTLPATVGSFDNLLVDRL
jgi:hypothetical protein